MSELHFPQEDLRCHRCWKVIPPPLMDCPTCLGKIETPASRVSTPAACAVTVAAPPPIVAALPVMQVRMSRRENGFLEAHMIAGNLVGKNILSGHRFEEMANAKAFVIKHLLDRLGQPASVEFGGCE